MNSKSMVWIGSFIGSLVFGYIPSLWGSGAFSGASILFGAIGALLGIYVGFKISR